MHVYLTKQLGTTTHRRLLYAIIYLLHKINTINKQNFTVDKEKSIFVAKLAIDRSTVIRSIACYRTVDRWRFFTGSISHVILTSQCRSVVHILGLDRRGY